MVYGLIVAAVFGCYVLTSVVLFKFPWLLHRKKNVQFVCRHISHRGGAGENYENTMTAFRHAVSLGTDMLELDVHLTKDGQIVVTHDPHLQRTTNSRYSVSDLDYVDLPLLKEKLPIDFMPGAYFYEPNQTDRKFPLLDNVFQAFPSTPINIDIKAPNDLLIRKVSELTKSYNREHLTVWGNVSDDITQRCFKENSNICLFFSARRVLLLVLQLYTGLLPFMPIKETHLEIFMPKHIYNMYSQRQQSGLAPSVNNSPASSLPASPAHSTPHRLSVSPPPLLKWWMKPLSSFANVLIIRPALFSHLAKRGIQTYLWVLNSEEEFHVAFKSGATGVMTDLPTKLKSFLAENPQYMLNYPSLEQTKLHCSSNAVHNTSSTQSPQAETHFSPVQSGSSTEAGLASSSSQVAVTRENLPESSLRQDVATSQLTFADNLRCRSAASGDSQLQQKMCSQVYEENVLHSPGVSIEYVCDAENDAKENDLRQWSTLNDESAPLMASCFQEAGEEVTSVGNQITVHPYTPIS